MRVSPRVILSAMKFRERDSDLSPHLCHVLTGWIRPELLGQHAWRVLGGPASHADESHGIDVAQHAIASPGVSRGVPRDLLQHGQRLHGFPRVGISLHELARAHQNRSSIIAHACPPSTHLAADDPHGKVLRRTAVGMPQRKLRALDLVLPGLTANLQRRFCKAEHAGGPDGIAG